MLRNGWTIALVVLGIATTVPASRDGWPDTHEGRMGRKWAAAFSSGEPAMREFLSKELVAGSLEKRSVDERLVNYRKLKERFGKLVLGSVVGAKAGELTVKLMAPDATLHEFVFTLQTDTPYKLVSVGMKELVPGGHAGMGGFHH